MNDTFISEGNNIPHVEYSYFLCVSIFDYACEATIGQPESYRFKILEIDVPNIIPTILTMNPISMLYIVGNIEDCINNINKMMLLFDINLLREIYFVYHNEEDSNAKQMSKLIANATGLPIKYLVSDDNKIAFHPNNIVDNCKNKGNNYCVLKRMIENQH